MQFRTKARWFAGAPFGNGKMGSTAWKAPGVGPERRFTAKRLWFWLLALAIWGVAIPSLASRSPASGRLANTLGAPHFRSASAAAGSFRDGLGESRVLFSSKEWEPEAGLSYYGYRFYNPSLGRWTSRDPLGETADPAHSLYRFIQNNIFAYVDFFGLENFDKGQLARFKMTIENTWDQGKEEYYARLMWANNPSALQTQLDAIRKEDAFHPEVKLDWAAQQLDDQITRDAQRAAQTLAAPVVRAPSKCPVAAKTTSKPLTVQAADLVKLNDGKNRVTLRSPSQQMEIDLAGKGHGGVPTPHTKVSSRNPMAPNQPAYNTKKSPVEPATQQDIRMVRRYLEWQE